MALDLLFAIRGLLAFVSFTEFTNAGRCFLPHGSELSNGYVRSRIFTGIEAELDPAIERTVSHLYGLYCFINGLIIIHTAIFAHYRPLVFLSLSALTLKLLFLLSEVIIFGSIAAKRSDLLFPFISCIVSLAATVAVPFCTGDSIFARDENSELLRKMQLPKKKRI